MGDVIQLPAHQDALVGIKDSPRDETLLLTEGLDLLAAYTSIRDASVREAIRLMVAQLAASFYK